VEKKMSWPLRYSAIVAFAIFAMGCSEKADGPPTGPEFHTILNTFSSCDPQHISQLANSFFQSPRQQAVKTLVDALAASAPHSLAAKNAGFDIMAQMEGAVNEATSGDPAVGSNLVNHLLLCMYNPTSEAGAYPASFPDTFTVALTPSLTGAFAQRSGGNTGVFARSTTPPKLGFSGIAPDGNWGVTGNPSRVVFYGRPATTTSPSGVTSFDAQTYDWRTIPHNATFNPDIIIAVCVNSTGNTLMLNEQGVAVLAFEDAGFLAPPGCSTTTTALLDKNSPFELARGLIGFGSRLFTPAPLMAAVLNPGGVGGRSSKCCSKVGTQDVPSAPLTFVPDPPFTNVQAGKYFAVQVRATSGGSGVNGDCITLGAVNNNGTNTALLGANNCGASGPSSRTTTVNGVAGIAQFCVQDPKTGTITLVATGNIDDRNDQPSTAESKKLNVKPSVNVASCTP
jgi:hypothetical protein